jgi:hypothetical protein
MKLCFVSIHGPRDEPRSLNHIWQQDVLSESVHSSLLPLSLFFTQNHAVPHTKLPLAIFIK